MHPDATKCPGMQTPHDAHALAPDDAEYETPAVQN
jgi:hypothetical protein